MHTPLAFTTSHQQAVQKTKVPVCSVHNVTANSYNTMLKLRHIMNLYVTFITSVTGYFFVYIS